MNIVTLTKRNDGSYVVNGDYHVANTPEFYAEHAQCVDYEQHNPGLVGIEQEPEGPTFEERLAAVEFDYAKKLAALDASLLSALWADGANEVANRQALSAKRQQLTAAKDAAIMNILLTA